MKKSKLLRNITTLSGLSICLLPVATGCSHNDDKKVVKTFAETEWKTVFEAIEKFETSAQDEAAMKELCASFSDVKYIETGTTSKQHLANFIGKTKTVTVNNQPHKVRIICIQHEDIAEGEERAFQKSTFTFEFVNSISDENGYSLATFWNDTNDDTTANHDYLNSSIRKAIDGQGNGTANWFEKGAKTWSTTYANKSVLSMLPDDLQSKLKNVRKSVNIKSGESWKDTVFNTKLFLPTPKEMGYTPQSGGGAEGVTYTYYASATEVESSKRIKKQVKGLDGALQTSTKVDSGASSSIKESYAGYNDNTTKYFGGFWWLMSPNTTNEPHRDGWYSLCYGRLSGGCAVNTSAFAVAPCFCL